MIIAQLSDIHINADYNQFKTKDNFLKALEDISKRNVDLIVITGDLAEDNFLENYTWVKQKLNELNTEYIILNGNHDDSKILKQVFCDNYLGGSNYRRKHLLFLDTSSGYITEDQLCRIDNNDIVFTHFPILPIKHTFMNNGHSLMLKCYGDDNTYDSSCIQQRLEWRGLENVTIFCGHYHFDNFKQIYKRQIQQFVCPSTQVQLNSNSDELKIGCYSAAYRLINVTDYELETEVVRIP